LVHGASVDQAFKNVPFLTRRLSLRIISCCVVVFACASVCHFLSVGERISKSHNLSAINKCAAKLSHAVIHGNFFHRSASIVLSS